MTIVSVNIAPCDKGQLPAVVAVGVPFSKATEFYIEQHQLVLENSACTVHLEPITYWPNGALKWAVARFLLSTIESDTVNLQKVTRTERYLCAEILDIKQIADNRLALNNFHWILSDSLSEPTDINFILKKGKLFTDGDQSYFKLELIANPSVTGDIQLTWKLEGFSHLALTKQTINIHNKARASHPEGKWDLGDDNSFLIEEFGVAVNSQCQSHKITNVETNVTQELVANWSVTQHSSGGDNEFSRVHLDSSMKVPFNISGFEIEYDGSISTGKRFSPLVSSIELEAFQLSIPNFWQNFPAKLNVNKSSVKVGFFPKLAYSHELQPGESKTFEFWTQMSGSGVACSQNQYIQAQVNPEYLTQVEAIAFFAVEQETDLQAVINLGLSDGKGFDAKKELIDEFGWRNFGDLYADHENAEFAGDDLIISHYNNQYDPLHGFLRQYLKTANSEWLELALPLAAHIKDIDIYQTNLDRDEYNNGLFWHTDHYVDAATASHRTYSKNQPKDVYQDHAGGGGPGGQHCYTSGLALHYLLTADETSKQAVLKLADWITHVYEGTGGVLDYVLAYKNADYRIDLKNVKTGQYPLDRGTGNYIVALLDSYDVTGDQSYLDRASLVIKHTVDLEEDLTNRHLTNVEDTWFYTVFLQAVCRYIWQKNVINQLDESREYAIKLLIKFSDWMAEHERPYLTKPEILEFPNETWTAQDLRKVNVLLYASKFAPEKSQTYTEKALEIRTYLVEQLSNFENNHYCRILCLLMQNEGMLAYCKSTREYDEQVIQTNSIYARQSSWKLKELLSRVRKSSIKKEFNWLAARSQKVADIQNKLFK